MAVTEHLPPTSQPASPLLSAREEAARFAEASDRLLERARQDPRVAEKFLRDIGFYEMMDAPEAEETPAKAPLMQAKKRSRK